MLHIIAAALAFSAPALAAAPAANGAGAELLAKADSNGDGLITKDEALAAREAAFKRADRNGDGVLDQGDAPRLPGPAAQYRQQTAQFKKQFDRNGDGKVTLEEVRSAPTTYFDAADTNKDGALDKAEVEAARAAAAARRP